MAKIKSRKSINIGIVIILVIFVVCIFWFVYFALSKKKEGFFEPDPETGEYDIEKIKKEAVIPLHIYQTWHTKDLPPKMRECVEKLKKANPEFTHHLYDDDDCREFIKEHFEPDVLDAFDRLIPGAYKADLWRYCVLHKKGGIYLDIKYEPVDNFKFISCVDKEYLVLERPFVKPNTSFEEDIDVINLLNYDEYYKYIDKNIWKNKKIGIYNALMICKPENPYLFKAIGEIVNNVKNREYGYSPIYITGPGLLSEIYDKDIRPSNFDLFYSITGVYILTKNKKILKFYDEYREEQKKYSKIYNYYDLWHKKKIYK